MDEMFWVYDCGREGLVEILGSPARSGHVPAIRCDAIPLAPPVRGQIRLVWIADPQKGDRCPAMVITEHHGASDFLAWATTFLEAYCPFSALCRIVDGLDSPEMLSQDRQPRLPIANACISLAIVEALTHGLGKIDSETINLASCLSTYSFCRARAAALEVSYKADLLPRLWTELRQIALLPERMPRAVEVESVWSVLDRLIGANKTVIGPKKGLYDVGIVDACDQLATRGEIDPDLLSELVPAQLDWRGIHAAMKGSREERVRVFEHAVFLLSKRQRTPNSSTGFASGYLGSLMSPGMLEYTELVGSHLGEMPTALLWYGLCCGLHPMSGVLNQFGGIGRRVLRDVLAPESVCARPTCDISIDELRVRVKKQGSFEAIRKAIPSFARVELIPFIWSAVTWRPKTDPQQMQLFSRPQDDRELRRRIDELERAIHGIREVVDRPLPNAQPVSIEGGNEGTKGRYPRKK